jgi:hypothetical protein
MAERSPRNASDRAAPARLVEKRWRPGDRVRLGVYSGTFLRREADQAVLLIGRREYRAPRASCGRTVRDSERSCWHWL